MRGAVLHAPGDVRFEERAHPTIINTTDAVIRTAATCVMLGPVGLPRYQPG
ncbi:threonine dehydrogenase-like Zn-dependent dehydrogenase [Streptomyces canus]|nr:threonine dehydrogenase-like Zn-dependent dehydrogenase [Streptomyces canus]